MRHLRRRLAVAGAAALSVAALAGCSFTSGLLPSSGNDPNVYFAQANILTAKKVPILVLPECSMEPNGTTQTCTGTTVDKQPIVVTADQTQDSLPMTITVGGKEIFRGSAIEAMKKAATLP
ncbi:MAG: hypothetical protein WBB44_08690 [Candidatus Nanopelagicales bacterium]|nr:hypothetical protein [Candidatus Nanopelagicales bacterium]